jgi:hypothetical protein
MFPPAEVIEKIQIYDQQSDQAQFTGFDDGERIKTMNIITKANMSNGTFGKLHAGYGTDERYTAGGNIHFFNDDQRISLLGMTNNINQQNFSSEDLLGVTSSGGRGGFSGGMGGSRRATQGGGGFSRGGSASDFLVGQQDGIATTYAVGINYTDDWGKKADISASYFFNHSNNDATRYLTRDFVGLGQEAQFYAEEDISNVKNTNHRFSGRINVELDSMNSLIIRPRLSAQSNNGVSNVNAENVMDDLLQSGSLQDFVSDLQTLHISANILWRHKFDRPRRTLSLNINPSYAPKEGENEFLSSNSFIEAGVRMDTINQRSFLDQNTWGVSANLSYTEPLGRYSMMVFDYRLSYQQDESDKNTFDFNPETGVYDDLNPFLSNVFSNDYLTHGGGGGYNYRKNNLTLTARANLQFASLMNEQSFPQEGSLDKDFFNVLPMLMMRYQLSTTKNLIALYRGRTQMPTIDQLQNVVDNTNPLLLSAGNPDLDQSYQHIFFLRYSSTHIERSSVFFAMLGGAYGTDYITNATYTGRIDIPGYPEVDIPPGAQFTVPVNLDGYWNIRSFMTYGFPISKIKSNLNLNLSGGYTRIPGLSNSTETESNNTNTTLGAVLASNISDRVDFNISSRSSLNWITNTATEALNNNYFQQSTRLRINVVIGPGITIRNDFLHEYYSGFSDDFDSNFVLWNLSVGKRVFKDQKGEVSIVAYDILKQNNSLSRNVTEVYVEDVQTNVLQQYFLFKFSYNLRNFDVPVPEDGFRPPWPGGGRNRN